MLILYILVEARVHINTIAERDVEEVSLEAVSVPLKDLPRLFCSGELNTASIAVLALAQQWIANRE